VELSPPLRRLLYEEGKLNRHSWRFLRIRLTECLRMTKRRIMRALRPSPSSSVSTG
jgi:hypothetical protein